MIKVVHTIHAFTATTGGTATCTYDLLCALNVCKDVCAEALVTSTRQPLMGNGETWIVSVENDEKGAFCISRNLQKALEQTNADLYHTNGLWRFCNHVTAKEARRKGKPYLITPHGMLYPQALSQSKWHKRLLRWAFFNRDLHEADCIHVTCEEEMKHVRALGFTNPIAIIANPIPLPLIGPIAHTEKVTFGYLGRLHPRKHVERLIEAMAQLTSQDRKRCELVIMGTGEPSYEAFLREEVQKRQLENVHFAGFVGGIAKQKKLASLSALFVPSDYENFGMIVAEALSCGTPVWASTGMPWEQLNKKGCGWWQAPTIENITSTMHQILNMSPKTIDEMGQIGRQWIIEDFSSQHVAKQMKELYHWILTKESKPSFVYD